MEFFLISLGLGLSLSLVLGFGAMVYKMERFYRIPTIIYVHRVKVMHKYRKILYSPLDIEST